MVNLHIQTHVHDIKGQHENCAIWTYRGKEAPLMKSTKCKYVIVKTR